MSAICASRKCSVLMKHDGDGKHLVHVGAVHKQLRRKGDEAVDVDARRHQHAVGGVGELEHSRDKLVKRDVWLDEVERRRHVHERGLVHVCKELRRDVGQLRQRHGASDGAEVQRGLRGGGVSQQGVARGDARKERCVDDEQQRGDAVDERVANAGRGGDGSDGTFGGAFAGGDGGGESEREVVACESHVGGDSYRASEGGLQLIGEGGGGQAEAKESEAKPSQAKQRKARAVESRSEGGHVSTDAPHAAGRAS
ncbi:cyclin-U1-1 [Gracilaria domingensis]|nr:cyclin-U1-1 [Gracilaria domingensis]